MKEIPIFLINMLEEQYGKEISNTILNGFRVNRLTTLRVNSLKTNIEVVKNILNKYNIENETVSWYDDALILGTSNENLIRNLDIYKDGKIYLQSLSSMLPPIILNPVEGQDILDMCAAPRWKNNSNCSSLC